MTWVNTPPKYKVDGEGGEGEGEAEEEPEEAEEIDTMDVVEDTNSSQEDSQTEGTLIEDVVEDPFAADIVLAQDLDAPQTFALRSPPPLSSMTSTSSRKRRWSEEPTTPTSSKRSRTGD